MSLLFQSCRISLFAMISAYAWRHFFFAYCRPCASFKVLNTIIEGLGSILIFRTLDRYVNMPRQKPCSIKKKGKAMQQSAAQCHGFCHGWNVSSSSCLLFLSIFLQCCRSLAVIGTHSRVRKAVLPPYLHRKSKQSNSHWFKSKQSIAIDSNNNTS